MIRKKCGERFFLFKFVFWFLIGLLIFIFFDVGCLFIVVIGFILFGGDGVILEFLVILFFCGFLICKCCVDVLLIEVFIGVLYLFIGLDLWELCFGIEILVWFIFVIFFGDIFFFLCVYFFIVVVIILVIIDFILFFCERLVFLNRKLMMVVRSCRGCCLCFLSMVFRMGLCWWSLMLLGWFGGGNWLWGWVCEGVVVVGIFLEGFINLDGFVCCDVEVWGCICFFFLLYFEMMVIVEIVLIK